MVIPIQNKKEQGLRASLWSVDDLQNLKSNLNEHFHLTTGAPSNLVENLQVIDELITKANKNKMKPLFCGSCGAEQCNEYTGKFCHNCQKDPSYQTQGPDYQTQGPDYQTQKFVLDDKNIFGTFESDYAEFKAFQEYLKFKNLSLQNKK